MSPKSLHGCWIWPPSVSREDAPVFGLCPYKGLTYFEEADADLFVRARSPDCETGRAGI